MPSKKTKKPKQKQKQKQKQIVKQNVKVSVESSGGSGGAGTPSFVPQSFRDMTGENIRQIQLLGQIAESLKSKPIETFKKPAIPSPDIPNPYNDSATVSAVFNAPINTNKPVQLGPDNELAKDAKKQGKYKKPVSERMSEREAGYFSQSTSEGEAATIAEIRRQEKASIEFANKYNPKNDSRTLNAVYNPPINTNRPVELGLSTSRYERLPAIQRAGESSLLSSRSEGNLPSAFKQEAMSGGGMKEEPLLNKIFQSGGY